MHNPPEGVIPVIDYTITTQNVLYSSGEYLVLGNSNPYIDVEKITGIEEIILDSGIGTLFKKEFRYSIDSITFSEFQTLNIEELAALGSFKTVWFQFRYILLSGGPATIKKIGILFDIAIPADPYDGYVAPNIEDETKVYAYPITYKSNFLWDPYKMNRAVRLYKDLNLMVNNMFGHDATYYRVLPQGRSKDVFLMEYSLYEHAEATCIKIVVPNNEFPDNKLNMGPFGVDFEMPFEVQIDKDYFQKIFGDGSGPQKRDVLHFPRTNRIYEIASSYLFRDFMNEPLYFKITLIKWLPKTNVDQSETLNTLEDYTVSAEKLFGDIIADEETKITNPQQFTVARNVDDPVRSYVFMNQQFGTEDLLNYYTVVAEHFYKMDSTLNLKKFKTKVDYTSLEKNITYYARFLPTSTQSDEQLYYSIKKVEYIGQDEEGFSLFSWDSGYSQLESTITIQQVFSPGSLFYLYKNEYLVEPTEPTIITCDTTTINFYKTKIVKYIAKNSFTISDDKAFSCWFRLKTNTNSKIAATFTFNPDDKEITLNFASPVNYFIGDGISLTRTATSNFNLYGEVTEIISSTSVIIKIDQELLDYTTANFNGWVYYTDIKAQRSYPHVFLNSMLNGKGIKIELYENRHFKITMNGRYSYFSIPNTSSIQNDVWQGLFINFSNTFKQLTLNVWQIQWNPVTKIPTTSDLRLFYNKTVTLEKEDLSSDIQYFLEPSFMDLTNIRLFNKVAETDKQSLILNQYVVKDAHLGIIIDNALIQSVAPYIGYTR